ncbi:MAG: homoserine dehydrogenase [Eggerthellaceae bacterium]|jgi:homoserine dehydrogenase
MSVKIGLVGTGTVGGGCIDIIQKHKDDFKHRYGIDIELARVCSLDKSQADAHGVGDLFTDNFHDIIDDPDIDIVIELIGGTTFAKTVVMDALNAGKNVVTANKALMATYGAEVFAAAEANDKQLEFEASVGGGIPIIGPLKYSLIANEIDSVMGIVNGTTNYMLTRMEEEGLDYDEALAHAQANGYAEADPTADVDGFDAAAKIAILASLAFNSRVTIDQVYTEGIRGLSPIDMATAKEMGYCVKLLAIANRTDKGVEVRVHPTMLPLTHQMATVNGVDNAIYLTGDSVGKAMFFGPGAGAGAAASAVMGDVLDVARNIQMGIGTIAGDACVDQLPIVSMDEVETKYYLRLRVHDRPGVLAATSGAFAKHGVSIRSMRQKGQPRGGIVDIVYVTHTAAEADMRDALRDIVRLDNVLADDTRAVVIRVEEQ